MGEFLKKADGVRKNIDNLNEKKGGEGGEMGRISLTIWGERGIRARSVYPPHPIKRDLNSGEIEFN
jgi:hypothetical protein